MTRPSDAGPRAEIFENTPARPLPLAVTMGEPGGVGGEITLKAWRLLRRENAPFFVIDDPDRLRRIVKDQIGAAGPNASNAIDVAEIAAPEDASGVFADALPVLSLGAPITATAGKAEAKNARAVIRSIEHAVTLALDGLVAAVVTNPIQKASLIESGFEFPGHTEFLGALTDAKSIRKTSVAGGQRRGPVMMLSSPALKVVPVTVHLPLSEAVRALTPELIVRTARVTHESLVRDWNITAPRIVLSGLNPHAGEDGALGEEDAAIIAPAVRALRAEGIDARGPAPADTLFHAEARETYDAALCMYHDQALIPAKTLAFHEAVNVTLGLPIIRTSPDHGTALDIAGAGVARPDSLIAAIRLARDMADNRATTR